MAIVKQERDSDMGTSDLCLGRTNPKKVIHHRRCHHARLDYPWARGFGTLEELAAALVKSGALAWHHCCQSCCGDLDGAITRVLREGRVS